MIITNIVRALAASVVVSAVVFGGCSEAQQAPAGIVVEDPWAATTAPGATVAAGYVTLRNTSSEPAHLVSASSPRAERVELHEMSMEGGMMRMRPVDAIVIPAGGAVTLAPGGLLIATNVDASKPFRHSMEFILEWHLICRNQPQIAALNPDKAPPGAFTVTHESTGVNIFLEVRKPPNGH